MTNKQIVFRLVFAAILGGVIGIEREVKNRPAGFRTHVLVTLGSTLIMLISIDGFYVLGSQAKVGDPYRLAAQVVSGIGFLGAGTIMRNGNNINGLTTAASLWVSAGIGLAIGTGYYLGAIVATVIVLTTLMAMGLNDGLIKKKYKNLELVTDNRAGIVKEISMLFERHHVLIKDMSLTSGDYEEDDSVIDIIFLLQTPINFSSKEFLYELNMLECIRDIEYEGEKFHNLFYRKSSEE